MQRRLCAAILLLEAIAFGLCTPVLASVARCQHRDRALDRARPRRVVPGGGGLLRFPWGYWLGWAIQVAAIAVGFVVTTMFFIGAIFLALWATAYVLGRKIEVERAQWEATGEYPGKADQVGS